MRKVMETAGFSVVIVQGESLCYANPAAAAVSGYTREELMGMPFWNIVHPDYRDEVKAAGFLFQSGKIAPECREIKIICKDGGEVWLLAVISAAKFNDRPAMLSALLEMPERNAWESRLHYMIDDSADLICRWRKGGILTYVNKSYCRFFGRTRAELIGKSFMTLIPEDALQDVRRTMALLTPDNPLDALDKPMHR